MTHKFKIGDVVVCTSGDYTGNDGITIVKGCKYTVLATFGKVGNIAICQAQVYVEYGCNPDNFELYVSPAKNAGFVVGQLYIVLNDRTSFGKGEIVTFEEDDDTDMPFFKSKYGDTGVARLSDVHPIADDYNYDLDCKQLLQFSINSSAEDGTTISFHKQLTADQISGILAITDNN